MSSIESIRQLVSSSTGVPVELIGGETLEEMQEHAAAIMAYKQESVSAATNPGQNEPKTEAEIFGEWFNNSLGIAHEQTPSITPAEMDIGYPIVKDGGELAAMPEPPKTTSEVFAECFTQAIREMTWHSVGRM